jgi:hypothetical protein
MNSDIQAACELLSELRGAHESLPKHLQLRVICLLRASALPEDAKSRAARPDISRVGLFVSIL